MLLIENYWGVLWLLKIQCQDEGHSVHHLLTEEKTIMGAHQYLGEDAGLRRRGKAECSRHLWSDQESTQWKD